MPYRAYNGGSCEYCGEPLGFIEVAGGRSRQYCNNNHRMAAYRQRTRRQKRQAILQYNSELRQYWKDNKIDGTVLAHLQDHLIEYGKESAKHATETVVLACKLLHYDLTGKGFLRYEEQ